MTWACLRRARASAGLVLATGAVVAGGCGESRQPPDGPLQARTATSSRAEVVTVGQALRQPAGQRVTVRGGLVTEEGRSRLCESLLESRPPQCGSVALEVAGLDREAVDLEDLRGVAWNDNVTLSGIVTDGGLRRSVAVDWPGEPRPCPLRRGDDDSRQFDARALLGLREAEARSEAARRDCDLRVVGRDGRDFEVTGDLQRDRIDVGVRDGFVIALSEQGWTSYAPLPSE